MALHQHTPAQREAITAGTQSGLSTGQQFPLEQQIAGAPPPPLDASQQAPAGGLTDFSPGDDLEFDAAFAAAKQQGAQFFLWRGNLYHTITPDEGAATTSDTGNLASPALTATTIPGAADPLAPPQAPLPDLPSPQLQDIGGPFVGGADASVGALGNAIQQAPSTFAGNVQQDVSDLGASADQFKDQFRSAVGLSSSAEQAAGMTETRERRQQEFTDLAGDLGTGASQAFLGNSEPGLELLGRVKDQVSSDIDAATQLVSTLPENFQENLKIIAALLSLDENSPDIPESFKKVRDEFKKATAITLGSPSGGKSREADDFRHFEGAKNAAREAGILPTLVASTGHELKNIVSVIKSLAGGASSPGRAADVITESGRDIKNNLRGIADAALENFSGLKF